MPDGKVCYVEIPATDVETSAAFYTKVFGWKVRVRPNGERAFDDTTGTVSGTWVLGRRPDRNPGMVTYIMVDDLGASLGKAAPNGGEVAAPDTPIGDGGGAFATFRDPAGNLLGLYQEPRR